MREERLGFVPEEIRPLLREIVQETIAGILGVSLTELNSPAGREALRAFVFDQLKEWFTPEFLSLLSEGHSLLSDRAIVKHMEKGNVVIEPFKRENLGTASYDISLGEYFYREQRPIPGVRRLFNPYNQRHVELVWGEVQEAILAQEVMSDFEPIGGWDGISPDDRVILIEPHETILAHTEEFIGGAGGVVTTMMKARSSFGRVFIEIAKCAGWGDVGYTNRWTMEITNNSQHYPIPLVVGRRIGQMAFFEVDPILGMDYVQTGHYQPTSDIEELKRTWKPEMMLPRLPHDREAKKARGEI
ncbi:hypothetical protein HYV21_01860 [Candidatus Microgenomates bacterium]|nr:hypothetical protein [Candidatus Microgenomates bacterium]